MLNRKNIYRILSFLLLVGWAVFIFSLSSQDSNVSSKNSGEVIEFILENVYPKYKTLSENAKNEWVSSLQFFFRKSAHFGEYIVLGFLSANFVNTLSETKKTKLVFSAVISCFYAISDEMHQLFVSGRSCEIRDVLIDVSGSVLGIVIFLFVVFLINKLLKRDLIFNE